MIVADLFNYVSELQIAYKGQKLVPKPISELEDYAYYPIEKIVPGVHIGKPTIRVFINNSLSYQDKRAIKQNYLRKQIKKERGTN